MKLSLAITTYNRSDLTLKAFEQVLNDDRISEIVIVDDCSTDDHFNRLTKLCSVGDKVRIFWNHENIGMSRNKAEAISYCYNDWVIILDSDNVIDSTYLDAVENLELRKNVIYCPEFARPNFDFRELSGMTFDKSNAKDYIGHRAFEVLLNTCNFLVHRESYDKVYRHNPKIKESDTIWFNYLWLLNGGSLHVTPGMQYDHLVHKGSGWLSNHKENVQAANELKLLIRDL